MRFDVRIVSGKALDAVGMITIQMRQQHVVESSESHQVYLMSTGEGSNPNYLKPELVKNLIWEVDGTIVECNTAYGNGPSDKKDERNTSENHWKVIERHGF